MSVLRRLLNRGGTSFRIRHGRTSFTIPRRAEGADYILAKMERNGAFYEADLLEAIRQAAGSGRLALDCGANVGNHTLFFAGVMGLDVHAFEPVPMNADQLGKLLEINDLASKVTIARHAVGDARGEVTLSLPDLTNPGMYMVREGVDGITAPIMPIDDYLAENGISADQIAVLKIDVEGHEVPVVRGATGLLKNGAPVLSIELAGRAAFDEMAAILGPDGYHPIGIHCHTPTVLFRKGPVDPVIMADVLRIQDEFDQREDPA